MRIGRVLGATALAGAATVGYAAVIERNWFALRRFEVPVLPAGAQPLRILHISDAHLTPGRKRLMSWIRSLDDLDPDLVVNTGDSLAHPQSVGYLLDALGPLLDRPGVFVFGANDLFAPTPRNPLRYATGPSHLWHERPKEPDLPWEKLRDGMTSAGWLDLNNQQGRLTIGGLNIALAGVHDPHVGRDRYERIAGAADPAADLRIGVMHSPEPRVLDRFAADGYDLLLAGHTHGGQLCLPWYGTLVTNCGLDRKRARGLHRHPADGRVWLHVSAGLGTSPWAPARFACRPEASLLTLTARPSS
ncbi:MAG TPA: metallophosphoesterase [Streptosporangiaceae bacterium]|nr:metallophosphoesterase [Streptosporangiaceae bacterium]